ncbi:MAG: hypothetical protein ACOH12_15265 [Parvibaculaceae bacterium]
MSLHVPLVRNQPETARRVVVGVDTDRASREALALAARLAAKIDAGLSGVFVEDQNLLSLSALPFVREVSMSGSIGEIDNAALLRAMQAQAQIAKRVLERVAGEAHISWNFRVAHGSRLRCLVEEAAPSDTLILRGHDTSRHELGRTVRAATHDARADVLLAARGISVSSALSAEAPHPSRMSKTLKSPEKSLLAIDEGSSRGEACVGFSQSLADRIAMPFRRLFARGFSVSDLGIAARKAHAGLIVVNAGSLSDDDDAARLSVAAGCPVLLLGSERATLHSGIR